MIKVAIIVPSLDVGGAERMVAQLASSINREKFDVVLIVIGKNCFSVIDNFVSNRKVNVHYLDKNPGFSFNVLFKLSRYINKIKPDIVHTHLSAIIYAIPWSLLTNRKIIHTIHTEPRYELPSIMLLINRFLYKTKFAIPVSISEMNLRSISEFYKFPVMSIEKIYNPVDCYLFTKSLKSEKNKDIILISVARFIASKNHTGLIEAFSRICLMNSNVKLILIGEGNLRNDIKTLVHEYNLEQKVIFTGNIQNVEYYLGLADIFVLFSNYEGMPLSVIEAMSSSLPIISTNVGGLVDVVHDNGVLVDKGDINGLVNAIQRLIDNKVLREKMGSISRDYALQFDIEIITKKYEGLYEKYSRHKS